MTQRNIQPQTLETTSRDVRVALLNALPLAAALVLVVVVLITVQTGAGIGFA